MSNINEFKVAIENENLKNIQSLYNNNSYTSEEYLTIRSLLENKLSNFKVEGKTNKEIFNFTSTISSITTKISSLLGEKELVYNSEIKERKSSSSKLDIKKELLNNLIAKSGNELFKQEESLNNLQLETNIQHSDESSYKNLTMDDFELSDSEIEEKIKTSTIPENEYIGNLLDYGVANFNNTSNSPSFFIKMKLENGKNKTIWGKDLEKITTLDIPKGEKIVVKHFGKHESLSKINKTNSNGIPYTDYIKVEKNFFDIIKYEEPNQILQDEKLDSSNIIKEIINLVSSTSEATTAHSIENNELSTSSIEKESIAEEIFNDEVQVSTLQDKDSNLLSSTNIDIISPQENKVSNNITKHHYKETDEEKKINSENSPEKIHTGSLLEYGEANFNNKEDSPSYIEEEKLNLTLNEKKELENLNLSDSEVNIEQSQENDFNKILEQISQNKSLSFEQKKDYISQLLSVDNKNKDVSQNEKLDIIEKISFAQKIGASFKIISSYIGKLASILHLSGDKQKKLDETIYKHKIENGGDEKKVSKTTFEKLINSIKIIIPALILCRIFLPETTTALNEKVHSIVFSEDKVKADIKTFELVYSNLSSSDFKDYAKENYKLFDSKELKENVYIFEKILTPKTEDDYSKLEIILEYKNCFNSLLKISHDEYITDYSSFCIAAKNNDPRLFDMLLEKSDISKLKEQKDSNNMGILAHLYKQYDDKADITIINKLESLGFSLSETEVTNILDEKTSSASEKSRELIKEKYSNEAHSDLKEISSHNYEVSS